MWTADRPCHGCVSSVGAFSQRRRCRATKKLLSSNLLRHAPSGRRWHVPRVSRRDLLPGPFIAGSLASVLLDGDAVASYIDEEAAEAVFQSSAPSVVAIEDYKVVAGQEVQEGVGSGFVWDTYGHIVTNYHCIAKLARDQSGQQVRPRTTHRHALSCPEPVVLGDERHPRGHTSRCGCCAFRARLSRSTVTPGSRLAFQHPSPAPTPPEISPCSPSMRQPRCYAPCALAPPRICAPGRWSLLSATRLASLARRPAAS